MFNSKISCVLLSLVCLVSMNTAFAGANFNYTQTQYPAQPTYNYGFNQQNQYPQNNTLRGHVIMIPAGTPVNAAFTSPLSSEDAAVGQMVTMVLTNDLYCENKLIASAGSTVTGSILEVSKAKRGGINGKLSIRFTQINTPQGSQIPISAVIKTDDSSGVLVGGTKLDITKEYAKDIAAGSAVGALSGLIFGSLASGDKLGRGVALGTAVGAGGGLAKSVWDKGNDVEIPAGAAIELTLTQPVTVSVPSYEFEN